MKVPLKPGLSRWTTCRAGARYGFVVLLAFGSPGCLTSRLWQLDRNAHSRLEQLSCEVTGVRYMEGEAGVAPALEVGLSIDATLPAYRVPRKLTEHLQGTTGRLVLELADGRLPLAGLSDGNVAVNDDTWRLCVELASEHDISQPVVVLYERDPLEVGWYQRAAWNSVFLPAVASSEKSIGVDMTREFPFESITLSYDRKVSAKYDDYGVRRLLLTPLSLAGDFAIALAHTP